MNVFPFIAGAAFSIDAVKKFVFPRISQIAIIYRHSSLSQSEEDFSIKSGDRMPYFEIEGASVYEKLKASKFHLLTFFDGQNQPTFSESDLPDFVDFYQFPLYPHIAEIFGADESFSVLLRPDNYVGTISSDVSFETIDNYLKKL